MSLNSPIDSIEQRDIGIIETETGLENCGIGYVIIPENEDRDLYIENCYRTNKVSIYLGYGYTTMNGVDISDNALQKIIFPQQEDKNPYGSPVMWIKIPIWNKPVVIDVLNFKDVFLQLEKNSFRFQRISEENDRVVDIYGRSENASLDIFVNGDDEKFGEINIKVKSRRRKRSIINIEVDGNFDLKTSGNCNIQSNEAVNVSIKDQDKEYSSVSMSREKTIFNDQFGNKIEALKDLLSMDSKSVKIGSKTQKTLKGEDSQKLISDIIQFLVKENTNYASYFSSLSVYASGLGQNPVLGATLVPFFSTIITSLTQQSQQLINLAVEVEKILSNKVNNE